MRQSVSEMRHEMWRAVVYNEALIAAGGDNYVGVGEMMRPRAGEAYPARQHLGQKA